jgi:hypothetical protein
VNTTSSAVNGEPSDHLTPGLSFQVTEMKSGEMPPFSSVGRLSASRDVSSPFSLKLASGSKTIEDANPSLIPPER